MGERFYDTLTNLISGMGTSKDKSIFTRYAFTELGVDQLDAAYRSDWIARKVIDIPAFDATRAWREWQADKDQITALEDVEKTMQLQPKLLLGLQRARLYGGAALILGVDQGLETEELDLETVKKDSLKYVHVVSRHEITAGDLELDIRSPYFGEPKYYESISPAANLRLHPSRVVRLIGAPILDRTRTNGWGDSIIQVVNDAIHSAGIVAGGVAALVQEAKIDVIRVPGLMDNIANADYEGRLKKKFGLAAQAKSLYQMLLLDKDEEWQRVTANFASLPDVLQMYLLIASGAADIPATRMLGQSPAGMSSTGESDIRNYYDRVSADQKVILTPALNRLDEVLIRSTLGSRPPELHYVWASLWQLDETQKATIAAQKAAVFKSDVDAGLIPGDVLREARINQLIEDGTYPGLEQIIDDFEVENGSMAEAVQAEAEAAAALAPKLGTGPAFNPGLPKPTHAAVAADAMTSRITGRDAKPKTLYVRRDVINADDIIAWATDQGIPGVIDGSDMHVTVAFSRQPVDWIKVGSVGTWGQDEDGVMKIPPGGARMLDLLGPEQDVLALLFNSSDLTYRWCQIKEAGATWDWQDYQPHITIAKVAVGEFAVIDFEPYRGPIVLGPEIFEEIDPEYTVLPGPRAQDQASPIPSVINVHVPITVPPQGGVEVTTVTKHDAAGRIMEFERRTKKED